MSAIRDFSQGYHATTTYRHVEAPMPNYAAGDLLLSFITIDDSAGTSAQACKGGMPVPYVFYNDDTTGTAAFTDYTVEANNSATGDWFMSPTVPTVNDCIYFGSSEKFNQVNVLNSTAGAATTNTVWALEYYNGSIWGTLTTTTDTFGANMEFVATVHAEAIWNIPSDWAPTTPTGSSGGFAVSAYWVRWRCTTSNTFQTRPVSTQAWIFPVLSGNNGWRQLFQYYAGTTPSPLSVMWKIASASEVDTTFFYVSPETADVELISISDVQTSVDSGSAALTVNVNSSGTYIRTTGSWATDGFAVGMQIMPTGNTTAANNRVRQISTITTTSNPNDTITVTNATSMATESGGGDERIIAWPFNSNITGGGAGSTFDGYTTSNNNTYRNALPQVTTTKDDCLIVWAANRDGVSVPSIIEGPCQLIAGKDGTAHADGMAWGYQQTAGATSGAVYSTAMSALVSEMCVIAVNPPHGGSTIRPAYTASDASVYISPFTGATYGSDSAGANTITTPFTGTINGSPLAAGGTTYTIADTGINSYHAMSVCRGVVTNGSWAGTRTTIASRNLASKNLLFHIQPYLPVDIQTTDSVSLLGVCGVGIGLASATGVYKVWHVGGNGVYGDTQRHQPVVIHSDATAGLLSHAGSFAVSGGSGTFAATSRIYVGASWAAATKRAKITSVSGSAPNQTINYSTYSGYGYTTDFALSDAVVEYTSGNQNNATGTAGAVTSLNAGAVVEVGFMVSGKIVLPVWIWASGWVLDTWVVAGGIAASPIDIPQIVKCYAAGHERRSAIQQGSKQALFLGPVQIGDGTNFTYLNLDGTAIEFPRQYNKGAKEIYYNSTDNVCGLKYYAATGDTIIHKNSVISSSSRYFWGLHSSYSTSVTPDFSGLSVIGAGTITLARAVTITGLTINDYSTLDVSGLTFTGGTIKSMPATNDSITTSSTTVISSSAITTTTVTAGNRWISVAIGDVDIFTGCTFIGSSTTGHAIRISSGAGTNNLVGNTFTSYGPTAFGFHTTDDVTGGASDWVTKASHGYTTGDPIRYMKQGGSVNMGLSDDTTYYVRSVSSSTIAFYATSADAVADTSRINLTSTGSETHYINSLGAAIFNDSGGLVTLNISGGGSIPTYRNGASASTVITNNVTVLVHVSDNTGADLENARVYLAASDDTGDMPFQAAVTSITRVTTTATVTHTAAHGLLAGDYVKLAGITDKTEDNNGAHQVITVTSATVYTYTTTNSGSTSYTGTITATGALLYDLTDADGNISVSRTFTATQPVTGVVRKSTESPTRFKSFSLAGNTVSTTAGLTINVRMISDE